MDLKHDWKALNEVLFSRQSPATGASTLVILEDETRVVDGVASNGSAFEDVGIEAVSSSKERLDALASKYGTEQAMVLSKKILDQAIADAAALGSNYFQQLQLLRERALGDGNRARLKGGRSDALKAVSRRHFVLDFFGSNARRVLPRRFNVLLFIDQRPSQPALNFMASAPSAHFEYRAILLSYSCGQLDQFYEPDFSSLHQNRLSNWRQEADAIGQYLETRYILPCYGIFMFKEDWERCLETAREKGKPWRSFTKFYDEGRSVVYPIGITTKALLAAQRLMVYFSRLS